MPALKEMKPHWLVNYGCGFCAPRSWRNFDASQTLRFERLPLVGGIYTRNSHRFPSNVEYGDIVRGLPLTRESCQAVYASHVLEHLSLEDFRSALRNTHLLLVPGGVFRLVVPDLKLLARRYLECDDPQAAKLFMEQTSLGVRSRPKNLRSFMKEWLGNSSHLWMWDFNGLEHELSSVGFSQIRKCIFADEPVFSDVEDQSRFVDAIAVQCLKP